MATLGLSVRFARLGRGDWALGICSALLLVDLFGLNWFQYRPRFHTTAVMLGQPVSANGWQSFEVIGPLALVVCLAGIAIWCLAATRPSPAWPTVLATLLAPVSLALVVLVAVRVLLDPPSVQLAQAGGANVIAAQPGAYVGLALAVAIFIGAYLALRRDGVGQEDAPAGIELVRLTTRP